MFWILSCHWILSCQRFQNSLPSPYSNSIRLCLLGDRGDSSHSFPQSFSLCSVARACLQRRLTSLPTVLFLPAPSCSFWATIHQPMTRLCTVPRSSHSFLVLLSNSSRSQPIASTSIILVEHSLVSFLLYTIHERAFLNLHHMLRTVSPSAFLISAESVPKKCRTYGNSSKKSRFSNRKKIPRSFFLWCILSVNKVKTKIGYRHFKRVR